MAHTPGPWTADGSNVYADNVVVAEANCALDGCDDTARLIASAPDLLAALRVAREIACSLADPEHCLHSGSINWAQVRDEFGAAIEKAS